MRAFLGKMEFMIIRETDWPATVPGRRLQTHLSASNGGSKSGIPDEAG
jgi:hypothetical protein